jgi:hypothetical protein
LLIRRRYKIYKIIMRKAVKKAFDGPAARRSRYVEDELERISVEGGIIRGMLAELVARGREREAAHDRDMARMRAAGLLLDVDREEEVGRSVGPMVEEGAESRRPRRESLRELFYDCLAEPVGASAEGVSSLRATVDNTVVLGIWDRACLVSKIYILFLLA